MGWPRIRLMLAFSSQLPARELVGSTTSTGQENSPEFFVARWPKLYQLLLHKFMWMKISDAAIGERTKALGISSGASMPNVSTGGGKSARVAGELRLNSVDVVGQGIQRRVLNFSAKLMQLLSTRCASCKPEFFSYAMLIWWDVVVLLEYTGPMCRYACAACARGNENGLSDTSHLERGFIYADRGPP